MGPRACEERSDRKKGAAFGDAVSRHAEATLWLVFSAVAGGLFFLSLNKPFDHDEFEAVHSAWKLLQGERIYVDFLNQHHPLLYYLMAPVVAALGEGSNTIVGLRLVVFALFLGTLAAAYRIAVRVFDRETGIVCLLLLSTTLLFADKGLEIRPDVPQTLLALWGVSSLFAYFENGRRVHLFASAALLGVSVLFLQKVLPLVAIAEGLLVYETCRGRLGARRLALHVTLLALPALVYAAHLWRAGALGPYVDCNWLLNFHWNRGGRLAQNIAKAGVFFRSLETNAALWGGYAFGLLFRLGTAARRRLALLSAGALAAAFLRRPLAQDLMLAVPLAAVVSAGAVRATFAEPGKRLVAMLLAVAVPCHAAALEFSGDNRAQRQKVDYVLSRTGKGDCVYDGDIRFNVFRKDLDFFWFSVRPGGALDVYRSWKGYDYDVCALIDRKKPAVISNYCIPDLNDPRIAAHYAPSPRYRDLFLRVR